MIKLKTIVAGAVLPLVRASPESGKTVWAELPLKLAS